ncbi:MAG: hypothetical protein F4X07_10460 [Acidimicrobiaceae bacterium]|nr:hypothetical protein [Acidimicrobiaceae bacterium]
MNRRGRRFIELGDFRSHAKSLNVKSLKDDELEFYEEHCLLLPAVVRRQPIAHLVAVTQRNNCWPVEHPEDLEPPEALRRLRQPRADGLHPFDAERENNPLLLTPDCTTFAPWDADAKVTVTAPDGLTVQRETVERYYSPWQVHVVELLRQQKYYYAHAGFLRHIDPSHDLWRRHRLPESTEWTRSLRGMANGFEALERFLFADNAALHEAFDGVDDVTLPEPAQQRLNATVKTWARQALEISGLDEAAFLRFLYELTHLIDAYRRDERIALADDAEDYLLDAQRLAGYAFEYDWDGLLAAAEEHVGPGLSTQLRWLDPVEAAVRDARENLKAILDQSSVTASAEEHGETGTMPDEIVQFCLRRDLLEVLSGLQRYTYSHAELRRDRFPGFFHRGLRMLAMSGEQLARGVLDERAEHEESDKPHGMPYSQLIMTLGEGLTWLAPFKKLISDRQTSDKQGNLDQLAVRLAETAHVVGAKRDDVIANTLAAAVATRNLVSHRHHRLSFRDARTLTGPCADAVVLIWLTARKKGLV